MEHLSLIQTRVVADRRRTLRGSKLLPKKKMWQLKESVQQYWYLPLCKRLNETAHKHFYDGVTWWCCIDGDRFPGKRLCRKASIWQSDLLWDGCLDLRPALQGFSGSLRTSRFVIVSVCMRTCVWEGERVHIRWNKGMCIKHSWCLKVYVSFVCVYFAEYNSMWCMYTI